MLVRCLFQAFARDFPTPDLGQNLAPSQFKNEHKLPEMVYIVPNFLFLHFGENFIAKLQMHENLYKNVNENMFSFTFLCKFSRGFMKGN